MPNQEGLAGEAPATSSTAQGLKSSVRDTPITRFDGPYACLSNFHPSAVEWMGFEVPTLEHAFQLAKTLDPGARTEIAAASTPGLAKRLGRGVALRADWDESKCAVMEALLVQKFTRHAHLAAVLLSTGEAELVEGNSWGDTYWGVCNGVGRNQLGCQLMQVREHLRAIAGMNHAEG